MSKENLDYLSKVLNRRSFYGLMELYERNYALLSQLIPDLSKIPSKTESRVDGSPTLYLSIKERCKFTTMLSITYYFGENEENSVADPDLQIRVYHDARQVDAMSCKKTGYLPLKTGQIPINIAWISAQSMIDYKWDNNLFLEKWLKYSLAQGHQFCSDSKMKPVSGDLETVLVSG